MEKHILDFKENNIYKENNLPANEDEKIIYIFRDTSDKDEKTWIIHEILYIGESTNAEDRLNSSHEKIPLAHEKLNKGHFLTFTYHRFNGNTSENTIRAIENALIAKHKPVLNNQNKKEYHFEKYPEIEIVCVGPRSTLLEKDFTFEKNKK